MSNSSDDFKSNLKINEGIPQPSSINHESIANFKKKRKKKLNFEDYIGGILSKNTAILSQAITLIESSLPGHLEMAQKIIEKCLPYSGNSMRIGITGVPGVGKSSFIEALGKHITLQGHKLAVLAIDPSSEKSGGSIMGDKIRMEELSVNPNAFIRPSSSAGTLGGVARKTRETIYLCEASGYDVIFIETIGVGQSETAVHSMVDFFLLLMLSGAGDELQGIKRGIIEMADLIAITKADGNNIEKAIQAKAEYQNALHLFPPSESSWIPKVMTCSAFNNQGIDSIWDEINKNIELTRKSGYFNSNRINQSKYWMHQTIRENLFNHFYHHQGMKEKISHIEKEVLREGISSFEAASMLLSEYFSKYNPSK